MTDWNKVPFPELDEEQLRAICERHGLPHGPFVRLASTGVINSIWTISGTLVLRVPKNMDEGLSDTYTESVAAPAAHAAGIRTPALVAFDESLDIVDVPYTVYDYVPHDEALLERHPDDGRDGYRDLGRDLAALHTRVTDCADPLGRLDDPGRVLTTEWAEEMASRASSTAATNDSRGR